MNLWTEVLPTGSIGGAVVALIMAGASWLRRKRFAKRVARELAKPGGPEFGSLGWMWQELSARADASNALMREELGKVRSKGHATEAWCAQNAERLASVETAVFGANRMQSGEQERIDFARERRSIPMLPPATDEATTEPDPLPPFRDDPQPRRLPSASGRRSR